MDIIAVIAVIAFSFLFTLKETKYLNHQLLYIVMALVVILFYKILYYNGKYGRYGNGNANGTIEGFQDVTDRVSDTLTRIQDWSRNRPDPDVQLTPQQADNLQQQSEDINRGLNEIKYLLSYNESSRNIPIQQGNSDSVGSLNLNASQVIQDKELDLVEQQLDQVKATLRSVEEQNKEKKYTKIPVYSSCLVAEADGSYSVDQPSSGTIVSDSGPQVSASGLPIVSRVGEQSATSDGGDNLGESVRPSEDSYNILNQIIDKGLTIELN